MCVFKFTNICLSLKRESKEEGMCLGVQVSVKHCLCEQAKRSLPILKKGLPTSQITQHSLSTLSISS